MFPIPRFLPPLLLTALLLAATPAPAQVLGGLPGGGLPTTLPGPVGLPDARPRLRQAVPDTVAEALPEVRRPELRRLLRRHRDVLDVDPAGALVVRSEVVAIDPDAEALARARAAGFRVESERTLDPLGLRVVVLRSPRGTGTRAALRELRRLDPDGSYDFNHLYFGSGTAIAAPSPGAPATAPAAAGPVRVGLIDSGVADAHPALAGVDVRTWGCDGRRVPDAHGTAVASLLVGGTAGRAAPGSTLFAADIYCGRPVGGAVTGYAEAMAWLARERVGVINLSLVGPHNALLQRVTQALVARGHVLVAAVGNDGPAAAPLYPAAYPAVIGVTAVNGDARVLPEAGRGRHVDFAAPGSDLRAARPGGRWDAVRGTSFAAPLVAHAAARIMREPSALDAAQVRARLAAQARDLGDEGRDDTYGHGLVATGTGAALARTAE